MHLPSEIRISIHDVMPETFDKVQHILKAHFDLPGFAPDLLIVPGRDWQCHHIEQIKQWGHQGCRLVAHGWKHEISGFGGVYHRLHSFFVSRRVAEHLELDYSERISLMRQAFQWFAENGLPAPPYYVPPAWALGSIPKTELSRLPCAFIEVLRGDLMVKSGTIRPSPVLGYEADTRFRSHFLRIWNQRSINRAIRKKQLLRLSIHPYDFDYHLASNLTAVLKACHLGLPEKV